MSGLSVITWTLKIAGVLYIATSIPYFVTNIRFEVPADANHLLVLLMTPSQTLSAILHGLGAIALAVILQMLWRLREAARGTEK